MVMKELHLVEHILNAGLADLSISLQLTLIQDCQLIPARLGIITIPKMITIYL